MAKLVRSVLISVAVIVACAIVAACALKVIEWSEVEHIRRASLRKQITIDREAWKTVRRNRQHQERTRRVPR